MIIDRKAATTIIAVIALTIPIYAVYHPQVVNIYKKDYHAGNRNWSVGQDDMGILYFGNDIGLLEFDGISWNLYQTPNSLTVRSLAVKSHDTIFTGGYEEFGHWDRDVSGKLKYTSLSLNLDKDLLKDEDIWRTIIIGNLVYFQSFSRIFVYDYETVRPISSDKNFLLLSKVRDKLLIQEMGGEIFSVIGTNIVPLVGSDIFKNTDVRVILPYRENDLLIGTSNGLHVYDGNQFKEWNSESSKEFNESELNCGVLSSHGTYYFGTILNGIYEVDLQGKILNHISSDNLLQNNTVLSLHEDNLNNIWAALDRGITYIEYTPNISFYINSSRNLGTTYSAVEWDSKLIIGTNQGAFYLFKKDLLSPDVFSKMKIINGTQGQVWSFNVIDGRLFCNHNTGIKEISSKTMTAKSVCDSLSNYGTSGVYSLTHAIINRSNILLMATYGGLDVMDLQTKKANRVEGLFEPIMKVEIDYLDNVWLEHANKGVYRCKLTKDFANYASRTYFGGGDLPAKINLFKTGGRVDFLGGGKFYVYNDIKDTLVPNDILDECFKHTAEIKKIVHIKDTEYWALAKNTVYKFIYDGYHASLLESFDVEANDLSLVDFYENISVLNDSTSLICLDNGFLIYNKNREYKERGVSKPCIQSFAAINTKGERDYKSLNEDITVSYSYNSVSINFIAKNLYTANLSFQYMLEGIETEWSSPEKINEISYERLSAGKYTFSIRTIDSIGNTSEVSQVHFRILNPWYLTIWAYLSYIAIFIGILYCIWFLLLRRYRNIHLAKIRLRETKKLQVLTDKLQREVETKNAEMLTQASFIIQKNELILKLKKIVDDFHRKNADKDLNPLQYQITKLLNNNLDSEDDWKTFLMKFEEKHTDFFSRMKASYPDLTASDLRLCASLKLNLETKEIASLMNLSIRAVENGRYRLRKKMNVDSSQNLNEFIIGLSTSPLKGDSEAEPQKK